MNVDKPIHMAKHINTRGGVSPLCAKKPKALNFHTDLWTDLEKAVTCERCLALMKITAPTALASATQSPVPVACALAREHFATAMLCNNGELPDAVCIALADIPNLCEELDHWRSRSLKLAQVTEDMSRQIEIEPDATLEAMRELTLLKQAINSAVKDHCSTDPIWAEPPSAIDRLCIEIEAERAAKESAHEKLHQIQGDIERADKASAYADFEEQRVVALCEQIGAEDMELAGDKIVRLKERAETAERDRNKYWNFQVLAERELAVLKAEVTKVLDARKKMHDKGNHLEQWIAALDSLETMNAKLTAK